MPTATHAFLRRLRAAARCIQAGTPPDIPGLLEALESWSSAMPVPRARILTLIQGARNDLASPLPAAALSHLSSAIEIVERVQKQGGP